MAHCDICLRLDKSTYTNFISIMTNISMIYHECNSMLPIIGMCPSNECYDRISLTYSPMNDAFLNTLFNSNK